jgi:hypothetical protein
MNKQRGCLYAVFVSAFVVGGCNSPTASISSTGAEEVKTLNLSNVIGQSGQVLANELGKYRLKESDPTPDDDIEIPGGQIRVYDLGNGMDLQLGVTRDGKATSFSVSYTEGLGFRIEDAPLCGNSRTRRLYMAGAYCRLLSRSKGETTRAISPCGGSW